MDCSTWMQAKKFTDIIYEKSEGIAKITINRPEVRNAFRPLTVEEMKEAFCDARDDASIGVVILTGFGGLAFCSGGDQRIRQEAGYADESGVHRLNVLDLQRQIRTLPKPVIAMVAGYAVGGGHVLHMICDITIAADNAIFQQTGPKVGSFDGGYGASYMARIIGQKKAREFWFLCRQYNANDALEMGLVNKVVPLAELEQETLQWCREILSMSPIALRCLKAALNADCDGQAGLQELAGNATMLFYMTPEGQEGKNAFSKSANRIFHSFNGDRKAFMIIATNSLQAWVKASRPKTLGAISCPILLGSALAIAHGQFSLLLFFVTMLAGVFLQILANIVNDYGDFIRGSDSVDRLGPPRAMQMGWITKHAMIIGIVVNLLCVSMLGLWLVYMAGPLIFVIGIVAIGLCLAYTLGPMPIAYFGFAEIIIFIVFGPVVVFGAYFIQTQQFVMQVLAVSLSPGFLATALILANNLRDVVQDKQNGKRTIAVRFGDRFARYLIICLILSAAVSPLILVVAASYSPLILLSAGALLFPARYFPLIAREPISERFNLIFAAIGKSLFIFSILFGLGIIYGAS